MACSNMSLLWITGGLLLLLETKMGFSNEDLSCGPIRIEDRLECRPPGVTAEQCMSHDCCFDPTLRMCYFPLSCEPLVTLAGGYSAYMMLPGRESPGQGSMAMLDGGNWCSRKLDHFDANHKIEFNLGGKRDVYLLVSSGLEVSLTHPFDIKFAVQKHKWKSFQNSNESGIDNTVSHGYWGGRTELFRFTASALKIHPKPTHQNPCVKMTFVACPPPEEPTTEAPNTTTAAAPNVTLPPPPPPRIHAFVSADSRPSAIFCGSVAIILLISLAALVIMVDLPAFKRDFCIMLKNLRHFKQRISDWRTSRRLKRNRMGNADREMREVCEGGTRASLLDVDGNYRTFKYIDDAKCDF